MFMSTVPASASDVKLDRAVDARWLLRRRGVSVAAAAATRGLFPRGAPPLFALPALCGALAVLPAAGASAAAPVVPALALALAALRPWPRGRLEPRARAAGWAPSCAGLRRRLPAPPRRRAAVPAAQSRMKVNTSHTSVRQATPQRSERKRAARVVASHGDTVGACALRERLTWARAVGIGVMGG